MGSEKNGKSERGQGLLLDFQFTAKGDCILITRSRVPFAAAEYIAAAYSESVFFIDGAADVWAGLLYQFENNYGDWEECRPSSKRDVSPGGVTDESRVIIIDKLTSLADLHRAQELFIAAAGDLVSLFRRKANGEGG